MSKYEIDVWEYADTFKNLDTNETFYGEQVCELLEQKDQRIAELEEQLKNAIVPKFKIGQEVWYIEDNQVNSATIDDMWIEFNGGIEYYFNLDLSDGFGLISKTNDEKWEPHFGIGTYYVFATLEEAQAKLEELKGE